MTREIVLKYQDRSQNEKKISNSPKENRTKTELTFFPLILSPFSLLGGIPEPDEDEVAGAAAELCGEVQEADGEDRAGREGDPQEVLGDREGDAGQGQQGGAHEEQEDAGGQDEAKDSPGGKHWQSEVGNSGKWRQVKLKRRISFQARENQIAGVGGDSVEESHRYQASFENLQTLIHTFM